MSGHDDELARIRAEYERRARDIPADFYSLEKPANLFARHGHERALLTALKKHGRLPLASKRILEVGCGTGQWFVSFERLGARRELLSGIELDEGLATKARARAPGAQIETGDAGRLPWPDGRFDLVFQATVFTSILDENVRRTVAAEMVRVLAPGGAILWYDFVFDNPWNKGVRGIKERQVAALFPGFRVTGERVTLVPPLARRLVPISWVAASLLERLRVLNSHCLLVLERD
jgi:ubiquinone/menaquinone biosynthesis C-methylase UbiE